jgi:hypothetical protein
MSIFAIDADSKGGRVRTHDCQFMADISLPVMIYTGTYLLKKSSNISCLTSQNTTKRHCDEIIERKKLG